MRSAQLFGASSGLTVVGLYAMPEIIAAIVDDVFPFSASNNPLDGQCAIAQAITDDAEMLAAVRELSSSLF